MRAVGGIAYLILVAVTVAFLGSITARLAYEAALFGWGVLG